MPSLFKFLLVLGVIGAATYAGLYVLSEYYEPQPKETRTSVSGVKVRR